MMKVSKKKSAKKKVGKKVKLGRGFLDRIIDKIPVELHLPSYNYCGPGMFYNIFFSICLKKIV